MKNNPKQEFDFMRTNRPSPNKVVASCAMHGTLEELRGTENEKYLTLEDNGVHIPRERTAFMRARGNAERIKDLLMEGFGMCQPMPYKRGELYPYKGSQESAYYTNMLSDNYGCLKSYFKTNEAFNGSNIVFVDVDHGCYDASAFFGRLGKKLPTVAVPSYSDDRNGERRYHLVYGFDVWLDKDEWLYQARAITTFIENATGVKIDHSMLKPNQYMNGSNKDYIVEDDVMVTDYVYSVGDFSMTNEEEDSFEKKKSTSNKSDVTRMAENGQGLDSTELFSTELVEAMKVNESDMSLLEWAMKFHNWKPITRREGIVKKINGTKIVVIDDDTDARIDPKCIWTNGKCEKVLIELGKRARTLYSVACSTRFDMIHPTADDILLNIINFNHANCDSSDDPVSRREMIRIVNSVMSKSDEDIRDGVECKTKKIGDKITKRNRLASKYYVIDCESGNKQEARRTLETDNNWMYIEMAIHNLEVNNIPVGAASITKEIKSMYEEGIINGVDGTTRKCTISRSSVVRYLEAHGMSIKPTLDLSGLDSSMSIRDIRKIKHCGQDKAYEYLNELTKL